MKSELHGINCSCCESKSPEAIALLEEINSIIGSVGPSNIEKPKESVVKKIRELAVTLKPIGDISSLVFVAEALFSLPDGNVDFEAVKLVDKEKKLGKFKVSELSEHPDIDITKILDIPPALINQFKSIKISVSIPTINAVLSVGIGPLSIDVNFKIGLGTLAWGPVASYSTPEEALANLEGTKYKKMLSESGGMDADSLKKLAAEQFTENKLALMVLSATKSTKEFFEALNDLGLNITEDIDVAAEAKKVYSNAKKMEEIAANANKLPEPENTLPADIGKIKLCPIRPISAAPYSSAEIEKVREEACEDKAASLALNENENGLVIEMPNVELPNPEEELKKIQDFLSEVDTYSKAMQSCAKAKAIVDNKHYFFLEQKTLNQVTRTYFEYIRNFIEEFYGQVQSILYQRDSYINEIVQLNQERRILFSDFENFRAGIADSEIVDNPTPAFSMPGTAIFTNLDGYSGDPTGGATNIDVLVGVAGESLTLVTLTTYDEYGTLNVLGEDDALTQQNYIDAIANLDQTRQSVIDSLQELSFDFNQYKNTIANINNQSLNDIRIGLQADASLISNLVGYTFADGLSSLPNWSIKTNSAIYLRSLELWTAAYNSPPEPSQGNISGVSSPLTNYIYRLDLPEYSEETLVTPRKGVFENGIWNPFYSAKRIDYFFTYQEQGYNQPKPEYSETGQLIGTTVQKKVKNGEGLETAIEVPKNIDGLNVDPEVAKSFLETLDVRLRLKVAERIEEIQNGETYQSYVNNVLYSAAKKEASDVYFLGIENRSFLDGPRTLYGVNSIQDAKRKAYVVDLYQNSLLEEISKLEIEMDEHQKCVDANKKKIEEAALKLTDAAGTDSQNLAKKCKTLLGSDPIGQKPSSGMCPSFLKDCYWKEYTKLMQLVSLMPIPELDPQNLAIRLFRYYPVAIQIPVPTPIPGFLPTLAMGKIDLLISVPLPLVWQHIVTVPTPLGVMVIWIALAGPIPSPFIMLIDEKGEATFMLTSRGPCSIPHPTVGGVNPLEEKSLLDILLPKNLLKVDASSPIGKLLTGNTNNDIDDPDSNKNVIDKLKDKIKSSFSQIVIADPPSLAGNTPEAQQKRKKIKKAFESIPPDAKEISDALAEIKVLVTKAVDGLNIGSIKIPKDDKKLMMPTLGPAEIIDNLTKAADTAAGAPAAIANQVLKDLGLGIKTINLTKKIKEKVLAEVDTPEIRQEFKDIDAEIAETETQLSSDPNLSKEEKIRKRVKIIKKIVKKPLQKAADRVKPEDLGFIAKAVDAPPLPFPCYANILLPPVPPYIYLIIAAFKAAPSIIDALSDDAIVDLVSFELNLEGTLPNAEQLFYKTINGILNAIPNLEVPDGLSDNMFKQTIDMVKQIPKKFKVRLPKPGQPVQLVIPGSLIKTIIKEAVKLALDALVAIIMAKVAEAIAENNLQKIIAVALIIKALLGANLSDVKGTDIKAFINGLLESSAYPALDAVSTIVDTANSVKGDFLSIIELFQFPPKPSLPTDDGPFIEVGTKLIKPILDPIINNVLPLLFNNLPYPVTLLAASSTPARLAFTKLHPTKPFERVPTWESMSLNNVPFVVWLDQLVATAQRKSGLGSTYLVTAGAYQALP